MAAKQIGIVKGYAHMWPREIFDRRNMAAQIRFLAEEKGVYILYRDEYPYYIGKTSNPLLRRIQGHAVNPRRRYYNFWNMFSAFAVPNAKHRNELEGILIAAMPTANSSKPRLNKERLPKEVGSLMKRMRSKKAE